MCGAAKQKRVKLSVNAESRKVASTVFRKNVSAHRQCLSPANCGHSAWRFIAAIDQCLSSKSGQSHTDLALGAISMVTILPAANRRIEVRIANMHRYGCKAAGSATHAKLTAPWLRIGGGIPTAASWIRRRALNENYRRLV
jgi:hypothetical protein